MTLGRCLKEIVREVADVARGVRRVRPLPPDREPATRSGPPTENGLMVCPHCGPNYPDQYFTATADALATAYLSPAGRLTGWKDPYVSEEAFREVQCGSCGRSLGDLTFEDLEALDETPHDVEEVSP